MALGAQSAIHRLLSVSSCTLALFRANYANWLIFKQLPGNSVNISGSLFGTLLLKVKVEQIY